MVRNTRQKKYGHVHLKETLLTLKLICGWLFNMKRFWSAMVCFVGTLGCHFVVLKKQIHIQVLYEKAN